ncbi:hypothetical protein E2C01_018210 [Portunus trituberculatus]|uniref:Uncharacterized protein n=1 Tax=Portunus trituberculatus TaxID=210409 RepID=A0A5B7DVJ4_PORTR|nr:hypothetical protein [Portunus trituberculatus]
MVNLATVTIPERNKPRHATDASRPLSANIGWLRSSLVLTSTSDSTSKKSGKSLTPGQKLKDKSRSRITRTGWRVLTATNLFQKMDLLSTIKAVSSSTIDAISPTNSTIKTVPSRTSSTIKAMLTSFPYLSCCRGIKERNGEQIYHVLQLLVADEGTLPIWIWKRSHNYYGHSHSLTH